MPFLYRSASMHSSRPPSLGHLLPPEHSDCNGKGSPSALGPTHVSLEDNTEEENAEEEANQVSLFALAYYYSTVWITRCFLVFNKHYLVLKLCAKKRKLISVYVYNKCNPNYATGNNEHMNNPCPMHSYHPLQGRVARMFRWLEKKQPEWCRQRDTWSLYLFHPESR